MILEGLVLERSTTVTAADAGVRRRRRSAAGRATITCFIVGLTIVSVGLALTSRAASTLQSGYRIGQLKKQLDALKNENALLEAELASIQSPSRIEQVAREKLGMAPPEEIRVARLDNGWQTAMAAQSDEVEPEVQAGSLLNVLARIASGSRTAQARPVK